jgi:ferredoxin-thioredoxin reductase catalytic subunit
LTNLEREKEKIASYVREYARSKGYLLNMNYDTFDTIIEGLARNKIRYGKPYCPCQLITGREEEDRKYICPCENHQMDIETSGSCNCSLFFKA